MNKRITLWSLLAVIFCAACESSDQVIVHPASPELAYEGRVDFENTQGANFYWSGTTVSLNFEGEAIEVMFQDERGDNYYNISVDGADPFILRPDTTLRYYQLASGLAEGKHSVEIFKRTEWDRGKTLFSGFRIQGKAKVLARAPEKQRKMEFYGNSITAGYAVEDTSGLDRPDSTFTNNYLSYANLTARHFDAEYRCICKSGIGITISWFPMIMPEIYDRLNPEDSTSQWSFSSYAPDIVVVNLMQNDSWLVNMPERAEFKTNFGDQAPTDDALVEAYQGFIANIRREYPKANIISALGNMDATKEGSKWPGLVSRAVAGLNDDKIYTHFFPYKNTPGHPTVAEQEAMSASLIQFIDEHIDW